MQQGRRSASMKASYEALQQFTQSTDVGVLSVTPSMSSSDLRDSAANPMVGTGGSQSTKKQKKYTFQSLHLAHDHLFTHDNRGRCVLLILFRRRETVVEQPFAANALMEGVVEDGLETEEWVEGDWATDPNEPRYCLCNQVSYGDMVACDNPDVRIDTSFFVFDRVHSACNNQCFHIADSVHLNGSTTLVSISRRRRKASGTARAAPHP